MGDGNRDGNRDRPRGNEGKKNQTMTNLWDLQRVCAAPAPTFKLLSISSLKLTPLPTGNFYPSFDRELVCVNWRYPHLNADRINPPVV